jgi:hypothetical protein
MSPKLALIEDGCSYISQICLESLSSVRGLSTLTIHSQRIPYQEWRGPGVVKRAHPLTNRLLRLLNIDNMDRP